MADLIDEEEDFKHLVDNCNRVNYSRPSLAQVKAVVAFMEKHPELANKKQRLGPGQSKYKKFWFELANVVNAIEGSTKSSKGWLKFWSDKKRFTMAKHRQIKEGKLKSPLTLLEQKIFDLCEPNSSTQRKKKAVKQEPCNGDDFDLEDNMFIKRAATSEPNHRLATEAEEKQLTMLEKMIGVMDHQASAMTQMAQASLSNSNAMERIAEASHVQALAVDRLVGSFETIGATAHDIRNAILGIDYTLKRCYPIATRQNSTLFS